MPLNTAGFVNIAVQVSDMSIVNVEDVSLRWPANHELRVPNGHYPNRSSMG